jgi:beta-galactosidase
MRKSDVKDSRLWCVAALVVISLLPGAYAQSLTDLYNGERGRNFNAAWKFFRGDPAGAQAAGFGDASWRTVNLPHDWSIELTHYQNAPGGRDIGYLDGGTGWYRKSFTVPVADSGKKIFIDFDGVYMNCETWINGTSLGVHPYGYTSYEYDLTPYLHYGSTVNVVAVRINNQQASSRWYTGSGIYRNVWLTKLNPVHVAYCGLFATTPVVGTGSATANISTDVRNESNAAQQVTVYTSISDAQGVVKSASASTVVTVNANAQSNFNQTLQIPNMQLWSITSPYLYRVKTIVSASSGAVQVDSFMTTLGVRYFKFDANTGFSLNGQNVKIQGTCMHQDLGCLGTAINYRAMQRQVEILKEMGCNAIRTAHNDASPEFYDICNRLGMLVMNETFDCWQTAKLPLDYARFFTQWAQTDLRGEVRRDRNNPCVILWSLGNEIFSPTVATGQNLRNWVRMEDTTRPTTWACVSMNQAIYQQVADVFDVAGYNYNPGMYAGDHTTYPNRKIFGSETAAVRRSRNVYVFPPTRTFGNLVPDIGSCYDNSTGSGGLTAEGDMKGHTGKAYVAGEFIWTGFDYIGENDWPTISNNDGIIDRCGFPKDVYFFYQSRWSSKPMAHILPHWNWNTGDYYLTATDGVNIDSTAISGTFTVPVLVYTNCDSAELFLNNNSLGKKGFQANGALHCAWDVPFAAGTLRVAAKRNGQVLAVDTVRTAGAPARVRLTADRTVIDANGEDLSFITADIVDANGVICPRAANTINFSLTGPGAIVGVDNGSSLDHSAYKTNTRQAFSGKCLAVVQSAGLATGQISVTAISTGLTSGTVSVGSGATHAVVPVIPATGMLKSTTFIVSGNTIALQKEKSSVSRTIHIYDLSGRCVRTAALYSDRINLQKDFGIARGVYIVRVKTMKMQ